MPSPEHQEKRVDAGGLPAFDTATHPIGIPTNNAALLQQLSMTQAEPRLAVEALRLQGGWVVPKVSTASRAGDGAQFSAAADGLRRIAHHVERIDILIQPFGP